jgi:hypothetical protein
LFLCLTHREQIIPRLGTSPGFTGCSTRDGKKLSSINQPPLVEIINVERLWRISLHRSLPSTKPESPTQLVLMQRPMSMEWTTITGEISYRNTLHNTTERNTPVALLCPYISIWNRHRKGQPPRQWPSESQRSVIRNQEERREW